MKFFQFSVDEFLLLLLRVYHCPLSKSLQGLIISLTCFNVQYSADTLHAIFSPLHSKTNVETAAVFPGRTFWTPEEKELLEAEWPSSTTAAWLTPPLLIACCITSVEGWRVMTEITWTYEELWRAWGLARRISTRGVTTCQDATQENIWLTACRWVIVSTWHFDNCCTFWGFVWGELKRNHAHEMHLIPIARSPVVQARKHLDIWAAKWKCLRMHGVLHCFLAAWWGWGVWRDMKIIMRIIIDHDHNHDHDHAAADRWWSIILILAIVFYAYHFLPYYYCDGVESSDVIAMTLGVGSLLSLYGLAIVSCQTGPGLFPHIRSTVFI